MHPLLVFALVQCAAALPLDEGLLELSGIIVAVRDSAEEVSTALEGSGFADGDVEGSGELETNLEGSGSPEPDGHRVPVSAQAASEVPPVQAHSQQAVPSTAHQIRSQTYENNNGSFSYSYSTGDGTSVGAVGHQRRIGDGVGTVMRGHYSYLAPDGRHVNITWVADEGGFRAFGDAVPTPPAAVGSPPSLVAVSAASGGGERPITSAQAKLETGKGALGIAPVCDDLEGPATGADDSSADSAALTEDVLSAAATTPVRVGKLLLASEKGRVPVLADITEAAFVTTAIFSTDENSENRSEAAVAYEPDTKEAEEPNEEVEPKSDEGVAQESDIELAQESDIELTQESGIELTQESDAASLTSGDVGRLTAADSPSIVSRVEGTLLGSDADGGHPATEAQPMSSDRADAAGAHTSSVLGALELLARLS
ncbi:uncharacterized protein LOC122378481 [Amphibalanus amphitrite]|uniref:uncharacterized protein LOC122378481 n=1 Tax=Amphibalanus amphitrite TaxID=1232801 RepID=UPI001C8FFB6E|nr:uncharacterized protein LOC122378481 [Amphibalanus amphitrite]